MNSLREHVEMQISFALSQGRPEMIWRDAEPEYFVIYERAKREHLRSLYTQRKRTTKRKFAASEMALPPAHVIAELRDSFVSANG